MFILAFKSQQEEELFFFFYNKYNKLLYKYAFDILKNHYDVEDVLQDVWFKISNYIYKISNQSERKIVNFLITIVKNTAIDIYRKKHNKLQYYDMDELELATESFDEIYVSTEFYQFKEVLKNLNEKYRTPLLLKFTYGYSIKEIADFLDISEENVGVRIFRAKNIIKANLKDIEVNL